MRLFIAMPLEKEVRAELMRSQEQLKSRRDRITWVKPEQLHLTMRFLGDVPEAAIGGISEALDGLAASTRVPMLQLGMPGVFGAPRRPRVLWMGLRGQVDLLAELSGKLEQRLRALGFAAAEHGFRAHITLGRVNRCYPDLAAAHLAYPPLPVEVRPAELQLIESILKPTGPVYHVLTRHKLIEQQHENRP